MTRLVTQIRPADHGRRMTLDEFESAEDATGRMYELSRGVVTMVDVPSLPHAAQVEALREQLSAYRQRIPGRFKHLLSGSECKILLRNLESERHPDLSIYRSAPEEPGNWAAWIPDIVVEIVSPSSRHRDYDEKPEEYLLFGVREYWIVDRPESKLVVHRRLAGRWSIKTVKPPQTHESRLLPGFQLDVQAVFDAAAEYEV